MMPRSDYMPLGKNATRWKIYRWQLPTVAGVIT